MTWTYSYDFADTAVGKRNRVRLHIGDTDSNNQLLQNEELDVLIADEPNLYFAAADAAERLAAMYSQSVTSKSTDGKSISYSQPIDYLQLAQRLRVQGKRIVWAAKPYAGGISKSDKEAVEADDDRDAPAFELGLHDQVGTGTSPLQAGPRP